MKSHKILLLFFVLISFCLQISEISQAQTKVLDNFESYQSSADLGLHWRVFGYASKDFELIVDTTAKVAPGGTKYFKYVYNSVESTWGGVAERIQTDAAFFPLDLSSTKAGIEFYLKGDGTNNNIRLRYYNQLSDTVYAIWRSQPIALADTNWHIVYVPFKLDTTENYGVIKIDKIIIY